MKIWTPNSKNGTTNMRNGMIETNSKSRYRLYQDGDVFPPMIDAALSREEAEFALYLLNQVGRLNFEMREV